MQKIDLRSDTVTMPSREMLSAMMMAKAGDMVFEEDPSVNSLEEKAALLFGMEAAAYCPSGTMTNQIAIKVHTQPGDEVICSKLAHIYLHEGGGIAFNSGASVALIDTPDGTFTSEQILENINPDDPHKAHTRLVSIENTVNRGGGKIWSFQELVKIGELCKNHNLRYHLDGARLFNAIVETGQKPDDFGSLFDSISICLSKGLGAPVGSVLIGSKDFIKQAKRIRKVFGGTMRQAGFIAAAGLFALENNIARLGQDHLHARIIRQTLEGCPWVKEIMPGDTNIIIFSVSDGLTSYEIKERLFSNGILVIQVDSHRIRMVTHLDITPEMVSTVCETLKGKI
jgi:threonine aldolase